jgi:hypothetical protein
MVGAAGDTSIHLASDVGVFEEDDGSVIAEHATNAAQLAKESAMREIDISKVLVGSSGNPTDIMCRAAHLSLVGFASPSFGGFAVVAAGESPCDHAVLCGSRMFVSVDGNAQSDVTLNLSRLFVARIARLISGSWYE